MPVENAVSGGEVAAPQLAIVVAGANPGSGASVLSAAIADAVARRNAGHSVALFEITPPYRSSYMMKESGAIAPGGHETSRLRVTRRASGAQVVRLDSSNPYHRQWRFAPKDVPERAWWLAAADSPDIVIVDFGWPPNEFLGDAHDKQLEIAGWINPIECGWPTAFVMSTFYSSLSLHRAAHLCATMNAAGWEDRLLVVPTGGADGDVRRKATPDVAEAIDRAAGIAMPYIPEVVASGAATDISSKTDAAMNELVQLASLNSLMAGSSTGTI